jgi:uncharacterized membrane-anchored protein
VLALGIVCVMSPSSLRRRLRNRRRGIRFWDGFSVGVIAILAGVTLILVALAMRSG